MTLIEVFVPKDVLDDARRTALGERLVTELISAPGAPAELIRRGRDATWLVFHEPQLFTVGGRVAGADEPPCFHVRITVPGGEITDGMRTEMVARITRVLAEHDDDPRRFEEQPHAWVQIDEVPDGNLGSFGRPLSTAEITGYVVSGELPVPNGPTPASTAVIDPICGMTVELDDDAITLERDGVLVGFCCLACRDLFAASGAETVS